MSRGIGFNSRISTSGLITPGIGFNSKIPIAGNAANWAKFNGTTTKGVLPSGVAAVMGDINGSWWYIFVVKATDGVVMWQQDINDNAGRLFRRDVVGATNKMQHYVRQSNLGVALNVTTTQDVFDGSEHLVMISSEDTGTNAEAYSQIDLNTLVDNGVEFRQAMGISWSNTMTLGQAPGTPAWGFLTGHLGYFACGTNATAVRTNINSIVTAYQSSGREVLSQTIYDIVLGTNVKFAQVLNGISQPDYNVGSSGITWTDVSYSIP